MNKVQPPTYFFLSLIISVALHYTLPLNKIIEYPFSLIGFLFFVIGAVLNIWADQLFQKENTALKPFEKPSMLIQKGPFKISRNPMYLGMALLLVGAGFVLGSVISFIGTISFVLVMEIRFIPFEEKSMQEQFGEEFETYKKKVRRWL